MCIRDSKNDDRFYSHAGRRPLEPEVLADAISDVLGVTEKYGEEKEGLRAVALVNPNAPSRTLDVLGRCGREESCENSSSTVSGLQQKLHLFNGGLLNARIASDGSRLQRLLSEGKQPLEIVEQFYLSALSRKPNEEEVDHWKLQLRSADNEQAFLEDFVWGLMASSEFVNNH